MKLGAQMYTVRAFTTTLDGLRQSLERIARIGYPGVQISAIGPIDVHDVARACRELGLEVASTHEKWSRFLTELDRVIEEYRILGARHTAIGSLPVEYHTPAGIDRFLEELGPVARRLAAEGMDFSYHNHSHELARFDGQTLLARLYEGAGGDVLKAEIDTYWIQAGGADPAQWIRRLGSRQPLLHIKDMAVTPDRQQRFAPVGEGNLNWPPIVEAARQMGVEWSLVEQDDCYGADPFECLATSFRNARAMGLGS